MLSASKPALQRILLTHDQFPVIMFCENLVVASIHSGPAP